MMRLLVDQYDWTDKNPLYAICLAINIHVDPNWTGPCKEASWAAFVASFQIARNPPKVGMPTLLIKKCHHNFFPPAGVKS